jgi:voltage-gated potassium channel
MLTGVSSERLKLEDINYDELKKEYRDKSIKELDVRRLTRATVIGFKSQNFGFTFNPTSDLQVGQGDTIIIVGTS